MALPPPVEDVLRERPRPVTVRVGTYVVVCLPAGIPLAEELRPGLVEERRAGVWTWHVCRAGPPPRRPAPVR